MPVAQLTFDFLCQGYGWSETWYTDTNVTSLVAFDANQALPLMNKRVAMLAFEAALVARSSSFVNVKSDSYLIYTGQFTGGLGDQIHAASPHETIYTVGRSANATKRKGIFFRGIPDDAVLNGGIFNPAYAQWVGPATQFMDAIVQGVWGWMSNTPVVPKYSITGYTQTVDQYVVATTAGTPFAGVPVGEYKRVSILFKGIPSVLNGVQTVEVVSPNSFRSLKPTAVFPFTKPGLMTIFNPTFEPIKNYSFQKSGERRAGRPKLHTPGRRSARPKG